MDSFYFKVTVAGELVALYPDIEPALESAKFHLQDAKEVTVTPTKMTVDEYLVISDELLK